MLMAMVETALLTGLFVKYKCLVVIVRRCKLYG